MDDDDYDEEEDRDFQTSCFNGFFWTKHHHHNRQTKNPQPVLPQEPHRHFGVHLETLYKSDDLLAPTEDGLVPIVAFHCINYIRNVLTLEGLFRVSATWSEMNAMKASFEKGNVPNFSACENPHSISGILDLYLRELPDPLLTNKLYEEFLSIADKPEEEKLGAMKRVIKKLPPENTQFLKHLLKFFRDIISHSAQNKMDLKNLSIVFAPILLGGDLSQLLMTRWKLQVTIMEIIINYSEEIF